jgi:hypothetical protein
MKISFGSQDAACSDCPPAVSPHCRATFDDSDYGGAVMKSRTVIWIGILAVLIVLAFTITASAQRKVGEWFIMTYVPDNNWSVPVPLPVTQIKGNGVSFDFYPTADRAVLIADISQDRQFAPGKLVGKTLSARIGINATPGATFSYYNNDTGNADPGGFVRLYFQGVNPALTGCEPGWHPERPDCEAQYWWSNPLHIDLVDLAASGQEITLQALLSPEVWSDRDGHMGNADAAHIAWFDATVAHATKFGLSFGGGSWWAFGCGVEAPATASFLLYKFMAQ